MKPRDTESEATTHRAPRQRTPEAQTLRVSRFEDRSEPKMNVADVLLLDMSDETVVDRYRTVEVLGRGGMGEVSRVLDTKIGREVAVKTMRADTDYPLTSRDSARFLREARVQALLEHPAVVPVYDIGFDESGDPFFAMKRVRGDTLQDILEKARDMTRTQRATVTRHRLLSAYVTVCLAIQYAHERGVVHRDLKPDNIMLGPHGEVYVLDWGVSKIMDPKEASVPPIAEHSSSDTRPGEMIGTPGYMSPEQVLGQLDMVDARSDIYALGAILYEILTLDSLIPGATTAAVLSATLEADRPPPPPKDAAPELYTLCLYATRFHQEDRPKSAREVAVAVEKYLDGDRDQELRARLANDRADEAKKLANLALDGPVDRREDARSRAMREAGRALAILPDHEAARAVVLRLFATPPEVMPAEAQKERDKIRKTQLQSSMRDTVVRSAMWVALYPLIIAMGVRVTWLAAAAFILNALCLGTAFFLWRKRNTSDEGRLVWFGLVVLLGLVLSGVFGPLVFIPGFAAVNTVLFGSLAPPKHRAWVVGLGCTMIALPLVLEMIGVVPRSMTFTPDAVTITPRFTSFRADVALPALTAVSMLGIIVPTLLAMRLRDALVSADERLIIQKWHLAQLAPARLGSDA